MEDCCTSLKDVGPAKTKNETTSFRRAVAALALLACISALFLLTEDLDEGRRVTKFHSLRRQLEEVDGDHDQLEPSSSSALVLDSSMTDGSIEDDVADKIFTVCGRPTNSVSEILTPSVLQNLTSSCPSSQFDPHKSTLLLVGPALWGQTGNQLRSFVNAVQFARDYNHQLAIMSDSWAMQTLMPFFFATDTEDAAGNAAGANDGDGDWQSHMERALCVKIFHNREELKGWKALFRTQKYFFGYKSIRSTAEEYVSSHVYLLRTLFQNYNRGEAQTSLVSASGHEKLLGQGLSNDVGDMCSGINSVLGKQSQNNSTIYSVIHLRTHEMRLMELAAEGSGCDAKGSLHMMPDYVKSILAPIGMLAHPIVVISDGKMQSSQALSRLRTDHEIRPLLQVVPFKDRWVGGDITLAVLANVFIGNPASTLSLFVGESRKALGLDNTYLYRARDEDSGEWHDVCGDECLFDSKSKDRVKKTFKF